MTKAKESQQEVSGQQVGGGDVEQQVWCSGADIKQQTGGAGFEHQAGGADVKQQVGGMDAEQQAGGMDVEQQGGGMDVKQQGGGIDVEQQGKLPTQSSTSDEPTGARPKVSKGELYYLSYLSKKCNKP